MRRQAFLILLALAPLVCVPARAQQAKLDTTQFIVVGEGLAAGFADFALRDVYQKLLPLLQPEPVPPKRRIGFHADQ